MVCVQTVSPYQFLVYFWKAVGMVWMVALTVPRPIGFNTAQHVINNKQKSEFFSLFLSICGKHFAHFTVALFAVQ